MSPSNHRVEPVLEAHDLVKAYARRTVLDRVSFRLLPGERVALMGPSGSGKSTLLNCLAGIDRPDAGTVHLDGKLLGSLTGDEAARLRREKLGTVFQFFHLLPTLTAAENIELPLQLTGVSRPERLARVEDLLDAVGITHRREAFPEEMSGGEQQRVAIARALVHRPALILADEPTGNLDSKTGEAILNLLESLADRYGIAMILVTHSIEALRICHRTLHFADGRFVERRIPA
ncbi:MAG: ABC transporter ATP-binding protein [Kiritimatiellae bacterium]|nr:ABC transporter ATP-binding protein [Kiritimatiellia bacterium]